MNRNILKELNTWYESGTAVPLLIMGPRGVGKTYSVLQFAHQLNERYIYVNFETDFEAKRYYEENFESVMTTEERIVFIFDEIQASDIVLTHLNTLKTVSEVKVVCLSSFMRKDELSGFKTIHMYPMSFDEFLRASGREWYLEIIEGHYEKRRPIPEMVHEELIDIFNEYLHIGGMPSVVTEYLESGLENVASIQRACLKAITGDIDDYAGVEALKCKDIFNTVTEHIVKCKKKFTFSLIRKGVTLNMYSDAIDILKMNGVLICSEKTNGDSFRTYMFDSGVLNCMIDSEYAESEEKINNLLLANELSICLKRKYRLNYWESEFSAGIEHIFTAEVLENKNGSKGIENEKTIGEDMLKPVPVIISTAGKRKQKSLAAYREHFNNSMAIEVGDNNFRFESDISKIPEYAVFML